MIEDILIIVDYRGLYRQELNRHKGVDLKKLSGYLTEHGYRVDFITFDFLINESEWQCIKDKIILYTSSQDKEYRGYIDDIIYQLGKRNQLIPRYEILKAHEDKLYEEILLKDSGIYSLKSWIFATVTDVQKHLEEIKYPTVIKKSTGSGSISVYKAETKEQLMKIARKVCRTKGYYEYYPKYFYKKIFHKDVEQYLSDEKYYGKFIVQEYVPDLQEDWKVLVFGKKYYVLKRKVRNNDFRASGSGKFFFNIPPDGMLDYAERVFKMLDVPFLSIDLCTDGNGKYYLIEFQGVHFGPYTLVRSEHFFVKEEGCWNRVQEKSDLAVEYARAIVEFLKDKNSIQG